ncbi:MAG TPA: hypothetical protein VFF06_20355 [Polyangia bacterium]|nr:hypothetical protein [Polyangia bacterium]
MRLEKVTHGHTLLQKVQLKLMGLVMRGGAPDVVRALLYRKKYWGRQQNKLLQQVMRGPSEWSIGERELFAAFVSRQNQCPF